MFNVMNSLEVLISITDRNFDFKNRLKVKLEVQTGSFDFKNRLEVFLSSIKRLNLNSRTDWKFFEFN